MLVKQSKANIHAHGIKIVGHENYQKQLFYEIGINREERDFVTTQYWRDMKEMEILQQKTPAGWVVGLWPVCYLVLRKQRIKNQPVCFKVIIIIMMMCLFS